MLQYTRSLKSFITCFSLRILLFVYMSVCALCAYKGPWRPEEGVGYPATRVRDSCECLVYAEDPVRSFAGEQIFLTHLSNPNRLCFFFFFNCHFENFIVQKSFFPLMKYMLFLDKIMSSACVFGLPDKLNWKSS